MTPLDSQAKKRRKHPACGSVMVRVLEFKRGRKRWRWSCRECRARYQRKLRKNKDPRLVAREIIRRKKRSTDDEYKKRRRERWDPRLGRDYKLKSGYHISIDDYEFMLEAQGGVCAVCCRKENITVRGRTAPLVVDHDHSCCSGSKSCGKCVRGLLCMRCNMAMERVERIKHWANRAAAYLKKHRNGRSENEASLKRRNAARASGVCCRCLKRPAKDGLVVCRRCADYRRSRDKQQVGKRKKKWMVDLEKRGE